MDYVEFETAVENLVAPEVAAWGRFEAYTHAAFKHAGLSVEEAAEEVTAQFRAHGGQIQNIADNTPERL